MRFHNLFSVGLIYKLVDRKIYIFGKQK